MAADLGSATAVFENALRTFELQLETSRGQWDDSARRTFDQRFTEPLVLEGRRTAAELRDLATEAASALSQLRTLS
ncbi:hypothetical protein ACVGOW_27410 [Pseudonocardia saturnea]